MGAGHGAGLAAWAGGFGVTSARHDERGANTLGDAVMAALTDDLDGLLAGVAILDRKARRREGRTGHSPALVQGYWLLHHGRRCAGAHAR